MTEQAMREFEEKLDEILDWYDDDGKERFLRYVLGHVIPRQKARRQALATTEPEPTGMPEVKPWDHPEPQTMRWSDLEIRWIQSYGKRCWNAGFRHGDFSDENISYLAQIRDAVAEICPGASEGLLMNAIGGPCEVPRYVIDVVQKLKQDATRYRWLRDDTDSDWAICEWSHAPGDEGYYRDARAPHIVDAAIDAAMAQGVKG